VRERTIGIALAGLVLGGLIIAISVVQTRHLVGNIGGDPYARVFDRLDNPLDILFALGDGQGFLAFARDPTLSHPEVFAVRGEGAYRADRPVQGYLGWALSFGQKNWAEEGLIAATVLGCGLAAAACGELLRRRDLNPWLGLLLLILPGSIAGVRQFSPEVIGFGFVCLGLITADDERDWLSILFFSLAGLCRESYLIVPAFLIFRKSRRFAVPILAWLTWAVIVWNRFGIFGPTADVAGAKVLGLPFVGLIRAIPRLHFAGVTALVMATIPILVLACVRERRNDPFTAYVVAYGLLAIFLRYYSWLWWPSFSRPLLPLTAFALIALATNTRGPGVALPGSEIEADPHGDV
jgi:hypothetical protein